MNILVTGSNGFLAKELIQQLSADSSLNIYGLQRKDPSYPIKNVQFIVTDLSQDNFVNDLPNVDVIVHLAQSSQYRDRENGQSDMFNINIKSTFRLLEWAKRNGVQKFIYTSTGNVYKSGKEQFTINDEISPDSYYGASKASAELMVKTYEKHFEVTVCRVFSLFGKGQRNMMIPNIVERVKKRQPLILAQNKGIYLTPIHVKDAAKIIYTLIHNDMPHSLNYINISGKKMVSLSNIISKIGNHLNVKPIIEATDDDPPYLCGEHNDPFRAIEEPISILDPKNYIE